MALCDQCGNFDDQEIENDHGVFHLGKRPKRRVGYQPDLYFYSVSYTHLTLPTSDLV